MIPKSRKQQLDLICNVELESDLLLQDVKKEERDLNITDFPEKIEKNLNTNKINSEIIELMNDGLDLAR